MDKSKVKTEAKAASGKPKTQTRVQVAKFLVKTFDILEDTKFKDYVCWNEQGDALVVKDVNGFTNSVLPTFFKHNNFASFVRQLNMYGFSRTEDKLPTFRQENFKRGQRDLLALIKRKVTVKQNNMKGAEELRELVAEMKKMKARQLKYEAKIASLVSENANIKNDQHILWRQVQESKLKERIADQKYKKVMRFLFETFGPRGTRKLRYESNGSLPQLEDAATPLGRNDSLITQNSLLFGKDPERLSPLPSFSLSDLSPAGSSSKIEPVVTEPSDAGTAPDVTRSDTYGNLNQLLKDKESSDPAEYADLAKEMGKHLADQDNTLMRINTVESLLEDPLDSFLQDTSREQMQSLFDLADEDDSGKKRSSNSPEPSAKPLKKSRKV